MKKRAFLWSPVIAAVLFTAIESWDLMHRPDSIYIPVVFELLLFAFSYLVTLIINGLLIVPLSMLIQKKSKSYFVGLGWAFFVALIATTVAYAYEIFGYQDSILHPSYLYTLFVPFLLTSMASFYFLRMPPAIKVPDSGSENTESTEEPEGQNELSES